MAARIFRCQCATSRALSHSGLFWPDWIFKNISLGSLSKSLHTGAVYATGSYVVEAYPGERKYWRYECKHRGAVSGLSDVPPFTLRSSPDC